MRRCKREAPCRDTLILVVSGSLAIKALREDDEESDEDEEDHLENVERPTVQRAARSQSLSTAVGLDLDDDRTVSSRHAEQSPREKVVATLVRWKRWASSPSWPLPLRMRTCPPHHIGSCRIRPKAGR